MKPQTNGLRGGGSSSVEAGGVLKIPGGPARTSSSVLPDGRSWATPVSRSSGGYS